MTTKLPTQIPDPAEKLGVRRTLDLWWPTLIRYGGFLLAGYETIGDNFDHPAALVLAGGMMGLKEVLDTREKRKE